MAVLETGFSKKVVSSRVSSCGHVNRNRHPYPTKQMEYRSVIGELGLVYRG